MVAQQEAAERLESAVEALTITELAARFAGYAETQSANPQHAKYGRSLLELMTEGDKDGGLTLAA